MKKILFVFASGLIVAAFALSSCNNTSGKKSKEESEEIESVGESEEGEESGEQLAKDATYNVNRNGTHLMLSFDAEKNAFVGMVHNMADGVLEQVRVEVHLSNGTELGPTEAKDLAAGEMMDVMLDASGQVFETWSAHAEVGTEEHSSGEGEGEHGEEGEGEHSGEGRGEHK